MLWFALEKVILKEEEEYNEEVDKKDNKDSVKSEDLYDRDDLIRDIF